MPFGPTPRPDSHSALDAGFVQTTRGLQQVLRGGLQDMFGDGASFASDAMKSAFGGGRQAAVYGLPATAVAALERKGYPGLRPDHGPTEYVDMLDGMGHEVPDAFRRISLDASRAFYDPAPLDVSVAERVKAGLRALRSIPRLALMPDSADTR